MSALLAPVNADVVMTATAPLRHLCPFKNERDVGSAEIAWRTKGGKTLELHELRDYLDSFAEVEISHEELTDRIRRELFELLDVVSVETTWVTAGMEISCSTLPTHAAVSRS